MELKQEIIDAILAAVSEREGRRVLSCPQAFQIAERFGVAVRRIGDYCNAEGIKMVHCQLGCF
ncbi:MAG TPA: hypothetical protein PKO23_15885 [Candidatus Hydrogenedentes bacterium]|nr:hypothetical protein [Candidatus Hydrogenedentota bacterium]HOC70288.1 hypothetical protein [Candidatus Hydrogenedentota bacterium]HOH32110.1 hypothetical protein [Candidatus Hydrogenedentota bacterium]